MHKTQVRLLRKSAIATAIAASIGSVMLPGSAISDTYTWGNLGSLNPNNPYSDSPTNSVLTCDTTPAATNAATIIFTMLDPNGGGFANTSRPPKVSNQFQTPTCGTLTYDTETESGSMSIVAFDFFNGSAPAVAKNITIAKVPAGLDDGSGNLILANMLFDWHTTTGIPVSISYDAQALLNEMDGTPTTFTLNADGSINGAPSALTGVGAPPASDGTYVGGAVPGTDAGYLLLGPSPLATTEFNTTNTSACVYGPGCLGVNPSADIAGVSAVVDTKPNPNEFARGDGVGVGANPMQAGPFIDNNANFDFTSMTLFSFTDTTAPTIALNAHVNPAGTSPLSLVLGVDTYTEPGATCTDAAPVGTVKAAAVGGDIPDGNTAGIYNVTYDCTDGSGIDATQVTREVIVCGPGAPCVALTGSSTVSHECAVTPYVDAGAICIDNEDGTIAISGNGTDPGTFAVDISGVDVTTLTMDTVTWSCTDSTPSPTSTAVRTVDIVDTTSPIITINAALEGGTDTVIFNSSTPENTITYTDQGASVTDTCDLSAISPATSNPVDVVVPDTGSATLIYNVQYTAQDASTNPATEIRVVNVTRSQPVITLSDGMGGLGGGLVLSTGETYTEQGMDIIDAQDGDVPGVTADGNSLGLTYTIDSSAVPNPATAGSYEVFYNVTDSDGNLATQVIRNVQVGVFATGSNFTMLDAQGNVFGGTNDVIFDWDQSANTAETDLNFNMIISSQEPFPFFGFVWTAHHTRAFGPGTYSFDSGCTVTEIETTGCPAGSAASSGPAISMTVGPDQYGAHILFDWNTTDNIDVVNVWDVDSAWDQHGDTDPKNQLYSGNAGDTPDPLTDWKLVSTDANGDGINSSPMVDGPFEDFYANFSAGPGGTVPPPPPYTGTAPDTALGNSLLASVSAWGLFAGLMTLIGLRRASKK